MYVFEIIAKIIKKFKEKKKVSYKFGMEVDEELQETCEEHIYLPIDSTKKYLACKNCGHIIKNSDYTDFNK